MFNHSWQMIVELIVCRFESLYTLSELFTYRSLTLLIFLSIFILIFKNPHNRDHKKTFNFYWPKKLLFIF